MFPAGVWGVPRYKNTLGARGRESKPFALKGLLVHSPGNDGCCDAYLSTGRGDRNFLPLRLKKGPHVLD